MIHNNKKLIKINRYKISSDTWLRVLEPKFYDSVIKVKFLNHIQILLIISETNCIILLHSWSLRVKKESVASVGIYNVMEIQNPANIIIDTDNCFLTVICEVIFLLRWYNYFSFSAHGIFILSTLKCSILFSIQNLKSERNFSGVLTEFCT